MKERFQELLSLHGVMDVISLNAVIIFLATVYDYTHVILPT